MYKQLSMAVTLCTLAGGISTAQAQVMCGDVITTPEVLTSDLNCSGFNPALEIQGPGGRLDMRGFTVSCQGSDADGIVLTGSGAVLQNGTVSDCGRSGVVLTGSNHRVFDGMILEDNANEGMFASGGTGYRVTQTTSRNNGSDGFCIEADGGNFFSRNRGTNNGDDGVDVSDTGDTYVGNVMSGNRVGFNVRAGSEMKQNVAQGNDAEGFLVTASGNTLTRNTARNNIGDGIEVVDGALNNTLRDNTGSGNGAGDTDGDGGFDLEDDNVDCDNNAWNNNRGTRNQPCIQ